MPTVSAPASRTIELPSEGEIEGLVSSWKAPWPQGYRAWCRGVLVPAHGRGMVPWEPEKWHPALERVIGAGKDAFVLKAKGIRFTTYLILRSLWLGMWCTDRAGIYLTVNEKEAFQNADSFQERMRTIWNALPEWQRWMSPLVECPEGAFGTAGSLQWSHKKWFRRREGGALEEGASWLEIGPATPNAGSSGRYTEAMLDEMERYDHPDATLAGVMAGTRETGGGIVAGSTLTVDSSMSSRLFQEYVLGQDGGDSVGLFFGVESLPLVAYQEYLKKKEKAGLRGAQGLLELHRLYPRTPEEAMSAFGKGLATPEALRECHEERPELPVPEGLRKWALV